MVLASWEFLFFLTGVFVLYYTVFKKKQIYLILASSYLFYGSMSIKGLVLLLGITVISYFSAILIYKTQQSKSARWVKFGKTILAVFITVLLLILCVFKYTTNITSFLRSIDENFSVIHILLPVGLSFYIFQTIGYVIDVYRKEISPEKNFIKYAACIAYFPHIMQGPISQYQKLMPQLKGESLFDYDKSVNAVLRITFGFFKKLVIADQISDIITPIFANHTLYSGIVWWFALVLYAVQLYADFSGYMDIMIGSSQMLGIKIEENFERPYFSRSISEFWRRWHITLGQWFRNYLFYSLLRSSALTKLRRNIKNNGNKSMANILPNVISLAIVWILIGAWHGAGINFILYGVFHGSFVTADSVLGKSYAKWRKNHLRLSESTLFNYFRVLRTFTIVSVGYSLFRASDIVVSGYIFRNLISFSGFSSVIEILGINKLSILAALIGIVILWTVEIFQEQGIFLRTKIRTLSAIFRYPLYVAFVFTIFILGRFGRSSFIYFGF